MKYSVKSDKAAAKAAKARMIVAKNKRYIATMNRKMSATPKPQIERGKQCVDTMITEAVKK
jgi:hypothetical protein